MCCELHIECTADLSRDEHHSFRMGERATGRVSLLVGLLLASLLVGFSSADPADLSLQATLNEPVDQSWYSPEQLLSVSTAFVNSGASVSFDNDPSCDIVLNVYSLTGEQVHDGSVDCRGLSRGVDLFAGETKVMNTLVWDMKNEQNQWLPSGFYTVEAYHPSTGLNDTKNVRIQTPVILPDDLVFSVTKNQRTADSSGPSLISVNLNNPTSQSVDLSSVGPCFIEVEFEALRSIGMECFAGVDLIMPGEQLFVGHLLVEPQFETNVTLSIPGDDFQHSILVSGNEAPLQNVDALLSIDRGGRTLDDYSRGEVLAMTLDMTSTNSADQTLEFTSTCKAEMWVVDDFGTVVFDSRIENPCSEIDLEMELASESPLNFPLPQWGFFKSDGCLVSPGTFTVVVEVPEFALSTSTTIHYTDMVANPCTLTSDLTLIPTITTIDETSIDVAVDVQNDNEELYLRMINPCSYTLTFYDQNQVLTHQLQTLCNDYSGRKLLLNSGSENTPFPTASVAMIQGGMPILPDGTYTLEIAIESSPRITNSVQFEWPTTDDSSQVQEQVESSETFELTGIWSGILTEQGTCWVLNANEDQYLLSHARGLSSWQPTSEVEGVYVVFTETSSPACMGFNAPSVGIVEVVMEQAPESNAEQDSEETNLIVPTSEPTPPTVVTALSVVATTSILSLIFIVAASNESLRIPSTLAGLWFLGLLGKTHETTDGRYQRGRLMGYLTANPGCHFRALMAALDMSNGQITHHLRILEAEENVWRKKDGRLVRFYPFTNQLHPNMIDDDLPVPPLSPDPNSLQGKILSLLDEDGQLGGFPTQAELAKRLEKSQQLISHHLRTLQKYGLVERRKMGVKNRYKLTREAIFLLETNTDFSQD
jgi:DNA-binding MarR family transcriptional regulator